MVSYGQLWASWRPATGHLYVSYMSDTGPLQVSWTLDASYIIHAWCRPATDELGHMPAKGQLYVNYRSVGLEASYRLATADRPATAQLGATNIPATAKPVTGRSEPGQLHHQ